MNDRLNFRRKPLALAVAIAAGATPVAASAAAGRIEFAYGQVSVENAGGTEESVRKGRKIDAGDTVITERGRAQIRFTDGSFVSLQPKTSFKVDDYNYEGKEDGSERGAFSLFRGGLRTITGLIGRRNKSNYRLNTPVATIGIRGTEYTLQIRDDGSLVLGCNVGGCIATNDGGATYTDGGGVVIILNQFTKPRLVTGPGGRTLLVLSPPPRVQNDEQLGDPDTVAVDVTDLDPQQICDLLVDAGFTVEQALALVQELFPGFVKTALAPLDDGPGFAAAYATILDGAEGGGGPVVDVEFPVTADFTNGQLEGWASQSANRGNFQLVEANADHIIGWGRWEDPTLGASFDPPGPATVDGAEGGNLHYVIGRPTNLMELVAAPHGGRYRLLGNTTPTNGAGDTGTFNGATFFVDFANQDVDGSVSFSFMHDYLVQFNGLPAPSGTFAGGASVSSATGCMGNIGCGGAVAGLVAGDGAERGGFTYHVNDPYFYGNPEGDMIGAAVFQQDPSGPLPPPLPP